MSDNSWYNNGLPNSYNDPRYEPGYQREVASVQRSRDKIDALLEDWKHGHFRIPLLSGASTVICRSDVLRLETFPTGEVVYVMRNGERLESRETHRSAYQNLYVAPNYSILGRAVKQDVNCWTGTAKTEFDYGELWLDPDKNPIDYRGETRGTAEDLLNQRIFEQNRK